MQSDEQAMWSTGELLRLFLVPTLVALVFMGGIYWLRLQLPAGSAGQEQPAVVQVHLVPRPESPPIPVNATSAPDPTSFAPVTSAIVQPNAVPSDEAPTESVDRTSSPAETSIPSPARASAPADIPPNSAALKFQQALLRHIAKFQHYPSAARGRQLQGTVETLFSIGRNGRLLGVWVKRSSGQELLDKEAIETIKRAQPLPSIPSELPDRLNIQVQLAFDPS